MTKADFFIMCGKAVSIVCSMPRSVVAVVGIFTFYGFATLLFGRYYISLALAYLKCLSMSVLQTDKSRDGLFSLNNFTCVYV